MLYDDSGWLTPENSGVSAVYDDWMVRFYATLYLVISHPRMDAWG